MTGGQTCMINVNLGEEHFMQHVLLYILFHNTFNLEINSLQTKRNSQNPILIFNIVPTTSFKEGHLCWTSRGSQSLTLIILQENEMSDYCGSSPP